MSVQTYVDQARTRARAEREAVVAKVDAIDEFVARVRDLSTAPAPSSGTETVATGGRLVQVRSASEDRCQTVRAAFAETVRPHSVADLDSSEPLLETIRQELSDDVAVALEPTTDTSFTGALKRAVLAEAATCRAGADVLRQALEREGGHLETAGEAVDDITGWIADADEKPLTDLGFEGLQRRHEALARHRDRCERLAAQRQAFLDETTSEGVEAGVRHRNLIRYLYRDLPVDHPLLATVASLDDACAECQRAVRQHLIRRA
jgi:hypothetical protein